MIEHSPTIAELCKALHGAQGEMTGVVKDAKNPHFKNRYATLESVLDTTRPALQANGLSISQAPGQLIEGAVEITTMLMHSSGEWMRSTLHMPVVKRDPQGVGSAITYGLRYALMAVLGVPPTDDDDGERAMPDRGQTGQARPANGSRIEVTSGGKPVERSASQRMADEMVTALWKVRGSQVDRWLGKDEVKRDLECLDQADRKRVLELAEERGAIQ
jgi:hypothetical protein